MNETIIVSIIIPTYNCRDKLSRALQSIEDIDYPVDNYEVIVVDDGSSDGTGEYVKELISKTRVSLHYVYQENRGPAAARNNGIRRARGQYLLIIDSDCFVDRNILKHYLKHFPDETLGGVGGNVLPDSMNIITKYLDYIGVWRPGYVKSEERYGIVYLVTANAFFLKEAVIKAGYFDEDFRQPGGEEPELCYRMRKKGYYFKYDRDAVVTHSHRTTIKSMIKMFYGYGRGRGIFLKKWPDEPQWKPSFFRIILGIDAFRNFIFDYARNVNAGKAFIFLILNYLHLMASYSGCRAELKKSGMSSC